MALPAIGTVLRALSSIDSILSIGKEVYEWATGEEDKPAEPVPVKKPRKKHDTSKFTQYQYDFITFAHDEWATHNLNAEAGMRMNQDDLARVINAKMGTDKSTRSLARIWSGHVDRGTLPAGTAYFTY
jgi:hypothetical protein